MAELYQIATGSKKISNLAVIDSISGSAVIPIVMSNVAGGAYPISNGTTNQISYQDFRESVIENNPNIFTAIQTIRVGSGNNQQQTTLEGHDLIMLTGSGVTPVGTEGFKVELFANDGTPGAKLYTFDNTEVGTNKFKTFLEVGTGYGDVTFTRPVSFNNALTVNNNLLVNGVLTARQVQTSIVTSSVQYESGSTRFGDTFEDTHEFTGSLKVSGSLALNTLTQNRVLLVGSNGTLTDSPNLTFNGTVLGINATSVNTTAYVNINSNGLKVDGVINNPLIGAVTQSLIDIAGGLQAYTASLKGQAIVSSSQQIQNYNLFAVTSSGNTFYGNQQITGSLSISAGEFNVTTGSGNMTSSLIFDHTQNDGVTLELRHNDRLSVADHKFNVNVWAAGVYTTFVRNGVPYSILNVEAFDDNKIYLYRDTRLYNKSLVVDNNLAVKQNTQLTGSLIVSGGITGSLLATNGVVSSSNQLFELNNQTGSQSSINSVIGIVTASLNAYTASGATSTSNINSFTASQISVNALTQAVTSSLLAQTASQDSVNNLTLAVTSSLIGIVGGLQAYTASLKNVGIVSSSNQLFELNNQTGSQNSVNDLTLAVTSSLIGIVGGLQAYTASLKSVSIVSSSNQLFELNNQTGSQDSINNLTQAVTASLIGIVGGLQSYTASLKNVGIVSSSNQLLELNNQTGSQDAVNNLTLAVTSSLIGIVGGLQSYTASLKGATIVSSSNQLLDLNNQTGSQNSINNLTSAVTSSILTTIYDIQAYTASLKGAAIVSSSQQITNYNLFAQTSSASTKFYGDVTASGNISVGADSFTSPGGADKFIGVFSGQDSSIILQDSVETWEIYMNDDLYFTTGSTSPKNVMSLRRVTGNVEINEGNLVIGKAGKGIDFSITSNGAGTMTSELLNDYEEGTWTPVIGDLIPNDATMDGTYTRGSYVKIGRQVTVRGYILTTSLGSVTGNVKIKGLPFTNGSGFANLGGGSIGTAGGLNITAGHSVHISTPIGANYLGINVGDDAGGTTEMTAAEWSADGQIQMLATYFVD
jgi:hypothetical protein